MSVVARGKIKVDARRALGKLRDHMLVDPHLYATEIARAAVALGATRLTLDFDADDVRIGFDGGALDPSAVARLRDHVLAGESGDPTHGALRALGIGVTAALGLGPSFVDVHHRGTRLRFDASYLAEDGELPEPARSKESATLVHVHRRLGLETIRRAILGDVPREIALLVDASSDAPIDIHVRGELHPPKRSAVVLRVDLDEPSAKRAVLEVLAPDADVRPSTVFLERGVRLVSYVTVPVWDLNDVALPLRILIDADRLPTNASRSEVRTDTELWTRVRAHVPRALELALEALARVAAGKNVEAPGVEVLSDDPAIHERALGAIAASVAMAARSGRELPEPARALLAMPLLKDAVGRPLSLEAAGAQVESSTIQAYSGESAQPEELAPWLGGIPWLRGEPIERAFAHLRIAPSDERVAVARTAHARRQRALAHPPVKTELSPSPAYELNETFVVTEGPFAGLEGAVALVRREGPYRRSASARIFVEKRLLESMPLPAVSLPVDIALAWPGRILPRFEYDAVERGPNLDRALLFALRLAATAIGQRMATRDPEIVRLAILAWLGATQNLGDVAISIAAIGPLAGDAVWPTSEPGRLVSLRDIEAYARRTGTVCTGTRGRATDGRPVLLPDTALELRPLLPPKTKIVPYQRWLGIAPEEATRALANAAATMPAFIQIQREDVDGYLGALPSGLHIHHCGTLLVDTKRNGPGLAVVEDRAAVPNPERAGVVWHTRIDIRKAQNELRDLVIERCEKGELDPATVKPYLDEWSAVFRSKPNPALSTRIDALPALAAQRRREHLKSVLLEQPAWSKPPPIDRSTTHEDEHGTVSVAIPPAADDPFWNPPSLVLLFEGRYIGSGEMGLPVAGWVDIRDEELLFEFARLSEIGSEWTKAALRTACVDLARDLAAKETFPNDVAALRLCANIARSAKIPKRLHGELRRVKWPCVQGTERTIGLGAAVQFGAEAYPSWIRSEERSPYDNPILFLPPSTIGELRRTILTAIGCELEDVTPALARLQERRSRGKGRPPPRLDGTPALPILRATFESLGVTSAEGELELAAAPDVLSVDDRGVFPTSLAVPFPVRAIFRANDVQTALPEIAAAAERHLLAIAATIDSSYPPFVVAAIRAAACARGAQTPDAITRARVFPDSHGELFSMRELQLRPTIQVTSDPEHVTPGAGPAAVFLAPNERAVLSAISVLEDVTDQIRIERTGAVRRSAAPLERIALADHVRAACLVSFRLEGDVTGEAGLLVPEQAALRGIQVATTMRPLAAVKDDEGGWPIAAVVNDERVTPTPAFDGLAKRDDVLRIWIAIRDAAKPHVEAFLAAPETALGAFTLPFPLRANNVPCLGVFWLEPEWPQAPSIEVFLPGARLARAPILSGQVLPVSGRLYAWCTVYELERALEDVLGRVRQHIAPILRRAKKPPTEYAWDLRLLGILSDRDVKKELEGVAPDPALLRVVEKRAPHLIVPERPETVVAPADLPPESASFLRGLTRTILDAVTPSPPPPVGSDLERAIAGMKLTGDPAQAIVAVRSGRPIRYEAESKRVVVNTRHPSIVALERHPQRTFHLLTAAVSEINRELEAVTDSEELAILRDLLQQ